jgi:hypothetical protein
MSDMLGTATTIAEDVAKGASAGSIVPGVGTAIGAIGGLAMGIEPAIGQWLFGKNAPAVQAAVSSLATSVTGTTDPQEQATALADAAVAAKMRIGLAQIAAQQAEAGWQDHVDELTARLSDVANARGQEEALTKAGSPVQWAPVVISVVVLATFGAVVGALLLRAVPAGSEALINVLLGTLATMAVSVVSFWVGSSSDSRVKTHYMAQASAAAARGKG